MSGGQTLHYMLLLLNSPTSRFLSKSYFWFFLGKLHIIYGFLGADDETTTVLCSLWLLRQAPCNYWFFWASKAPPYCTIPGTLYVQRGISTVGIPYFKNETNLNYMNPSARGLLYFSSYTVQFCPVRNRRNS